MALFARVCAILSKRIVKFAHSRVETILSRRNPFALSYGRQVSVLRQYATVKLRVDLVLRSQPQAEALNRALTNDKSHSLGGFIRRLRVEGGFGRSMIFLKLCPNIDHFFFNFELNATTDNVTVLAKGLSSLRVLHLVVVSGYSIKSNKSTRALGDALVACVQGETPLWPLVIYGSNLYLCQRWLTLSGVFLCTVPSHTPWYCTLPPCCSARQVSDYASPRSLGPADKLWRRLLST